MVLAAPTLVETYAVLTRLPPPHRLSAHDAWTLLESNWTGTELIALAASEYWRLLEECRGEGISGGQVFDAVIAACARKARAEVLLTWNVAHFARFRHFLARAPDAT